MQSFKRGIFININRWHQVWKYQSSLNAISWCPKLSVEDEKNIFHPNYPKLKKTWTSHCLKMVFIKWCEIVNFYASKFRKVFSKLLLAQKNEILGGQHHLQTPPSHFTVRNPFLKAITDLIWKWPLITCYIRAFLASGPQGPGSQHLLCNLQMTTGKAA